MALATFQTLDTLMWLVATVSGCAAAEHFHQHRKHRGQRRAGKQRKTYKLFSSHSKGLMKTIPLPTRRLPGWLAHPGDCFWLKRKQATPLPEIRTGEIRKRPEVCALSSQPEGWLCSGYVD